MKLLAPAISRAVQHHRLQTEVKQLREESLERAALDDLVGTIPA